MFFVCMGAILLQKDRELNIHKLYTKNIPRFLIAIFLYGLLHKITRFFLGQYGQLSFGELLLAYPKKFITGELEFSFWFMYALIPIYFMLPILKADCGAGSFPKSCKNIFGTMDDGESDQWTFLFRTVFLFKHIGQMEIKIFAQYMDILGMWCWEPIWEKRNLPKARDMCYIA